MSFREVLAATRSELRLPPRLHPADLQSPEARAALETLTFDVDAFDLAWQTHLGVGGFPRAVAEWHRRGAVSDGYVADLAAWLRRDVDPDAPEPSVPLLVSALEQRASSPLSIRGTGEALGYGRGLIDVRLDRLVASFAAHWCPQRDDRGAVVPGAQAKLYLTDPLIAWLPSRLRSGLPEPDLTRLTEATLGVTVARAIDRLQPGRWLASDTIGYTRTKSGGEIDLLPVVVPSAGGTQTTVPMESKWVDTGWRAEARAIEAKYGAGIVATQSILDLDHPSWAVPAPLVALLLE